MKVADELCLAKGVVSPSFVDISTGKRIAFSPRNNRLSYMAAEAVAAAFGGDPSYIPSKIGFIYGNSPEMPTESEITRSQTWSSLLEELSNSGDKVVDVQVVNFSYSPSLGGSASGDSSSGSSSGASGSSDEGEAGDYTNILATGSNAITFHAVSNSQDIGVLRGADAFSAAKNNYVYQCLLLGYHNGDYYIIARASLKDGSKYLAKPEGFEVALDWTVTFH